MPGEDGKIEAEGWVVCIEEWSLKESWISVKEFKKFKCDPAKAKKRGEALKKNPKLRELQIIAPSVPALLERCADRLEDL